MIDPMIKRAYNEGFEAAATDDNFDPFYLGRHVSKEQRKAYRAGFKAGKPREES